MSGNPRWCENQDVWKSRHKNKMGKWNEDKRNNID